MASHSECAAAEEDVVALGLVQSGSNDKQSSDEAYTSAETGRYFTAPSENRSATGSRHATPEPAEPSTRIADLTEGIGGDVRNTNLDYFHREARFETEISEGQFTKVRGLSDCCRSDGKVELHRWSKACHSEGSWAHQASADDNMVVVKRVVTARVVANVGKERNERIVYRGHCQRHAEDCLNEIGVYCYLSRQQDLPQFILKMHTVFQAGSDVWLVLEHANNGDLFAVVQKLKREGTSLSANHLMMWSWQLLQAVSYLHKHGIGHRDISMENVLLSNGHVRLMDFGQSVQTHSDDGEPFRYFNALGKPYYRPPECSAPMQRSMEVHVPKNGKPGEVTFAQNTAGDSLCEVKLPPTAVPGQTCTAEPWGYTVPPVDVFACGVCMFIMATGMPPWRQANLSDPHFTWVHQCGVMQLLKAWKKPVPPAAGELIQFMMCSDPAKRPSAPQCLSRTWFEPMNGMAVPVHTAVAPPRRSVSPSSSHAATSAAVAEAAAAAAARAEAAALEDAAPAVEFIGAAGDPYGRCMATRSAAEVDMPCRAEGSGGMFAGDFYTSMDDSIVRSVPGPLDLERFSQEDLPPDAPADKSFAFEPTTFFVNGKDPAKLGNHLVTFLTMGAGAVVTKVRTKKFTIKAEADGEDGSCILKVRVYSQGEGRYAVEFQRRGGESTAFHKVYDLASELLGTTSVGSKICEADSLSIAAVASSADAIDVRCGSGGEPEAELGQAQDQAAVAAAPAPMSLARELSPMAPVTIEPTQPLLPPRGPSNSSQRFRSRPGVKLQRRSSPAALTRMTSTSDGSKNNQNEDFEYLASEVANPVGSGLNAVRWRSKSISKRPPNVRSAAMPASTARFNATI